MPTAADQQLSADIIAYYRAVEVTLLAHLRGRRVFGFGRDTRIGSEFDDGRHAVDLHVADLADLDEAVRSGIACFRLPGLTGPGMVSLLVRPGEGSGIDTVATAALALAE